MVKQNERHYDKSHLTEQFFKFITLKFENYPKKPEYDKKTHRINYEVSGVEYSSYFNEQGRMYFLTEASTKKKNVDIKDLTELIEEEEKNSSFDFLGEITTSLEEKEGCKTITCGVEITKIPLGEAGHLSGNLPLALRKILIQQIHKYLSDSK